MDTDSKPPRVGHKKSRKGCAQCKRRHVKCNEDAPCSNCIRHGVACSLAGGPMVTREDSKARRESATSSVDGISRTTSLEASGTSTSAAGSVAGSPVLNSLSILTGRYDRRPPGQDRDWQLDLQLIHHFMTHTRHIFSEQDQENSQQMLQIWQIELPQTAFACEYVMHALLSFSALHKAYVEPRNARVLQAAAAERLDKALTLYRLESPVAVTENANNKFIFTWLIALLEFATPTSVSPIDTMAEMLLRVKGIDSILPETWFWVAQGPFAPLLTRGFLAPSRSGYVLPEGMDFGLNHLDFMLGVEAMLPDDHKTCGIVLAELKQAYEAVTRSHGAHSAAAILCFPKSDPAAFSALIRRRVPQALILLAYYCVLLNILDSRWWSRGWSAKILQDVMVNLEDWKHWIEWPMHCIVMKPPQIPGATGVLLPTMRP